MVIADNAVITRWSRDVFDVFFLPSYNPFNFDPNYNGFLKYIFLTKIIKTTYNYKAYGAIIARKIIIEK